MLDKETGRADNSADRPVDLFFYGLYICPEILRERGVELSDPMLPGAVDGYRLRIGRNATLLRSAGSRAYGVLCSLTHGEIDRLYRGAGLGGYVPEAVLVETAEEKRIVPALCYMLLDIPEENESNDDYYRKLARCMEAYSLPVPESVQ